MLHLARDIFLSHISLHTLDKFANSSSVLARSRDCSIEMIREISSRFDIVVLTFRSTEYWKYCFYYVFYEVLEVQVQQTNLLGFIFRIGMTHARNQSTFIACNTKHIIEKHDKYLFQFYNS